MVRAWEAAFDAPLLRVEPTWLSRVDNWIQSGFDQVQIKRLLGEANTSASLRAGFDSGDFVFDAWRQIDEGVPSLKGRSDYLDYLTKMSRYRNEVGQSGNIRYYRVQGGTGNQSSQFHIDIDPSTGSVIINDVTLNVSVGDLAHAQYFQSLRPGSQIFSFELPRSVDDLIKTQAQPQFKYSMNPLNNGGQAPKIVDPTTPGNSLELPPNWAQILEDNLIPGSGQIID
jgi:hypothetical protein